MLNLNIELDIDMSLLANHDAIFKVEMNHHNHFLVTWLENGMLDILVQNVDFITSLSSVSETICMCLQEAWKNN